MTPFTAIVRAEGHGNLRVTVPMPIADQLHAAGVRPPSWARVVVNTTQRVFFTRLRLPPSRMSMMLTLPRWLFFATEPGDEISLTVDAATPYRARAPDDDSFDWLPFVAPEYLPVDVGAMLALWSRHETIYVVRRPLKDELYSTIKQGLRSRAPRPLKRLVEELKKKSPDRFTTDPGLFV